MSQIQGAKRPTDLKYVLEVASGQLLQSGDVMIEPANGRAKGRNLTKPISCLMSSEAKSTSLMKHKPAVECLNVLTSKRVEYPYKVGQEVLPDAKLELVHEIDDEHAKHVYPKFGIIQCRRESSKRILKTGKQAG
jgi:hypothetical protein